MVRSARPPSNGYPPREHAAERPLPSGQLIGMRRAAYAIVANGFADGPAQALCEHLVARRASVVAVSHPLSPEDGTRHVVATYASGKLVQERSIRLPLRPPLSFALDPAIPLRLPRVDTWFGFNPLACARGLLDQKRGRAGEVVLWSVDFVPDRFGPGTLRTRLYDRLDRMCCLGADARVELSAAARDARDRRHDLPATRAPTQLVPMGAWLERVPKTTADGFRERRVVFLSHLVRRQGADVLLDALALLRDRGAGVVADVVGTGPDEESLKAQTRSLALGDVVRFHGFVPDHREVERILASASLAVAPYRPGEGTFTVYADPGKVKAYLAAGLPILLTDVPPNAAELAREGGARIVPFDAQAIADEVSDALDEPETWRARRAAALEYAERFDWPRVLDGLLDDLAGTDRNPPKRGSRSREDP